MERILFVYRIHHRQRATTVSAKPSGVAVESSRAGHTQTDAILDRSRMEGGGGEHKC